MGTAAPSSRSEPLLSLFGSGLGVGLLLVARPETGRSFLLAQLAAALRERRVTVHELGPGDRLGDLLERLGVRPEHPTRPDCLARALRRALLPGTLLLVDDFERLDSLARRALEHLARLTPPPGSGWALSVLPDRVAAFPRCARHDLGEEDLAPLLRHELRAEPGPNLEAWLLREAGGSPRRLKLLTLRLRATGQLEARSGVVEAVRFPGGLLEALDTFEEDPRLLLQLACLADEPFSFELLGRASGLMRDRAERAVQVLLDAGLLEETRPGRLRVGPAELRQEVPAGLQERFKRRHHGRLAEALEEAGARGRQLALAGATSDAAWLLVEGARQAHEAGLLEEALQLWEAASRCLVLGDPLVGAGRADTLLALGRPGEAEKVLARTKDSPETRRALIDVKLARGLLAEARAACQEALESAAHRSELEVRLAEALVGEGDRPGAIAALERAIPEPATRLKLARLYLAQGEVLKLREVVEPLLDEPEQRFDALMLLAEGERLGGRGSAGRERLEEAAALAVRQRLPEREAAVRLLQAAMLEEEGDLTWASEACEQALISLRPGGESPALAEALERLARLRPAEAERWLTESVAVRDLVGEGGARARLLLGRWQLETGKLAEAADTLHRAAAEASGAERGEVWLELAAAQARAGSSQAALETLAQAAETESVRLRAQLARAELLVAGRRWPEAREALALLPCDERVAALLARIHEEAPGGGEARVRPGRRPPWKWLVAGLALLALALLWPRQGTLEVVSDPPGATVVVDGQRFRAPCTVPLRAGAHEVKVALQGYAPYAETVSLAAGQSVKLVARLESASGSVRITSRPGGASVHLEGRLRGTTPLELKGLPPGRYALKVLRQGNRPYAGAVDVVAGQTRNLSIDLLPMP